MTKTPLTALIIIIFNILMGTSNGEVFINEFSAKQTERILRWDENNQPFAGNWPSWWMNDFNNSNWKTGRLPIGYDLGNIRTNVKDSIYGISPSIYVIKTFQVSDADSSSSRPLTLSINYNDGFIGWLNGKEIGRANNGVKNSHIYWDQVTYRAGSTSTRLTDLQIGPSNELLKNGQNTLAIQVNNHNPLTSIRLNFSLLIDQPGAQETVLVPSGTTVRYFPGIMEPGSGIHEPAIFEDENSDNEDSDWIEIFNSGTSTVNISNWSLTDNESDTGKWLSLIHISEPTRPY